MTGTQAAHFPSLLSFLQRSFGCSKVFTNDHCVDGDGHSGSTYLQFFGVKQLQMVSIDWWNESTERTSSVFLTVKSSTQDNHSVCVSSAWILVRVRGSFRVFRTTGPIPLPLGMWVFSTKERHFFVTLISEAAAAGDHTGSLVNLFLKELWRVSNCKVSL